MNTTYRASAQETSQSDLDPKPTKSVRRSRDPLKSPLSTPNLKDHRGKNQGSQKERSIYYARASRVVSVYVIPVNASCEVPTGTELALTPPTPPDALPVLLDDPRVPDGRRHNGARRVVSRWASRDERTSILEAETWSAASGYTWTDHLTVRPAFMSPEHMPTPAERNQWAQVWQDFYRDLRKHYHYHELPFIGAAVRQSKNRLGWGEHLEVGLHIPEGHRDHIVRHVEGKFRGQPEVHWSPAMPVRRVNGQNWTMGTYLLKGASSRVNCPVIGLRTYVTPAIKAGLSLN